MRQIVAAVVVALGLACPRVSHADAGPDPAARPNVVVILADDLGLGDVRAFNPAGKIATPEIDRLAAAGMTFTDAHSGSAVCTPTRYGLLTGRYSWRTRLAQGVFNGYSRPLIAPGRTTLASLLKNRGYRTACVGKWHLGVEWALKEGGTASGDDDARKVDYARPFGRGPTTLGFDEFFGISASLDMPPYVFLEGDRATAVPTAEKTWIRTGPAAEDFEAVDVLPALADRAERFIGREARAGRPFFLYLALAAPHTPIVPAPPWQGKSGLTPYADFVMQVDAAVGRVAAALDRAGVAKDTFLVFTSDNGFAPMAGLPELREKGHDPCAGFRGTKADVFEGGHRVPFLVRWPGRVRAGSRCGQTVWLGDVLATCAELTGGPPPGDAAEDSVSLLPTLLGRAEGPVHEGVVHHSANGSFAIRQGRWKLALCPDSGGWSFPRPGRGEARGLPDVQLYDMEADPAESRNLAPERPEEVARLTALLRRYVADGRSTPGPRRPNDREVSLQPPRPAANAKKKKTS